MMRLMALLLGAVLSAPSLADEAHPLFAEGKSLYKQFCSHCHGLELVNPGTGSFDLRRFPQDDKPRFADAVNKGKGDMPAWGDILLAEEVDAIWIYVATRAGKEPFPDTAQGTSSGGLPAGVAAPDKLTACLARNGGAMSGWRHTGGSGFDYAVLKAVADGLGADFAVTWFESAQDEFADPVAEAYAMLSHGLCDIVAAHPVLPGTTGDPPLKTAALPRWKDMPESWPVHRQVLLEPLAATRPYRRVELGIVVNGAALGRRYERLSDLDGTRIGVQQGTMSEAILRRHGPPEAMRAAVTLPPGPKFLWDMEVGIFDATLIEIGAFDFHRRQNHISTLELAGYRHPYGFDISLAVLEKRAELLTSIDAQLQSVEARGGIAELAAAEKVTYIPPSGIPPPDLRALLR